jgi:hypothetical protein
MRFVPGYSEGAEPFGSSYVSDIRGYHTSGTEADDFVVCKLFTPLGDTCGWMGTEAWTDDGNRLRKSGMTGRSNCWRPKVNTGVGMEVFCGVIVRIALVSLGF